MISPDGRFIEVNDAVCTLLGYTRAELLALNVQSITHVDDLAMNMLFIQRQVEGDLERHSWNVSA